jgi:hypothetical protein
LIFTNLNNGDHSGANNIQDYLLQPPQMGARKGSDNSLNSLPLIGKVFNTNNNKEFQIFNFKENIPPLPLSSFSIIPPIAASSHAGENTRTNMNDGESIAAKNLQNNNQSNNSFQFNK